MLAIIPLAKQKGCAQNMINFEGININFEGGQYENDLLEKLSLPPLILSPEFSEGSKDAKN